MSFLRVATTDAIPDRGRGYQNGGAEAAPKPRARAVCNVDWVYGYKEVSIGWLVTRNEEPVEWDICTYWRGMLRLEKVYTLMLCEFY